MSYIPNAALKFGALSLNQEPIAYGKSRVSGSQMISYLLHCRSGCMPGQTSIFVTNALSKPDFNADINENKVTSAYKREASKALHLPFGPRELEICPYGFEFEKYSPHDDETFNIAIKSAYKQIFGNFRLMSSERPVDLERRLRNGDFTIREFIRGLAKSTFYLEHYFENVSQQRAIELSIKNVLGRPPKSQKEIIKHVKIIHEQGFYAHIDSLLDSAEYEEVFGPHIVPYNRCWNSPCSSSTRDFIYNAALTRSFATSDNAIHSRITLAGSSAGKSQLLHSLAKNQASKITKPTYLPKR